MKIPKISLELLDQINRVNHVLQLMFKLGLPLGIGILIFGSNLNSKNMSENGPTYSTALAELIMAVACLALSASCLLEGYVFGKGFAQTVKFGISGVIVYTFASVILMSSAIVLCVMAIREWGSL